MPSSRGERLVKFSPSSGLGDDPVTLPIVLSESFPIRCPAGMGVNLAESGLLDAIIPYGVTETTAPPDHRSMSRPANVSMPAAPRIELPERLSVVSCVEACELPPTARPRLDRKCLEERMDAVVGLSTIAPHSLADERPSLAVPEDTCGDLRVESTDDDCTSQATIETFLPATERDGDSGSHDDARLTKVVDAWPMLPHTVQSTILALVRASTGK